MSRLRICVCTCLTLFAGCKSLVAGPVYATGTTKQIHAIGSGGGTSTVLAYSEFNGQVNANHTLTHGPTPPAAPTYSGPANVYNTEQIPAAIPGVGNKILKPVVGLTNITKYQLPMHGAAKVESKTGPATGWAEYFNWNAGPNHDQTGHAMFASGNSNANGQKSTAAGRAIDPFLIDPGTYPLEYEVDFSLGKQSDDPYAGLEMGASISTEPEPLFYLSVYLVGENNDLVINFESNPILGLDDNQIALGLYNALDIVGNDVSMAAPYPLFSTYLTVSETAEYSDFLSAAVATVPEAGALVYSLAAFSAIASRGRRRFAE